MRMSVINMQPGPAACFHFSDPSAMRAGKLSSTNTLGFQFHIRTAHTAAYHSPTLGSDAHEKLRPPGHAAHVCHTHTVC